MKKSFITLLSLLLLCGCGQSKSKTTIHSATKQITVRDQTEEITVLVAMEGDHIISIKIDETTNGQSESKRDLQDQYKMKDVSYIEKEWYEQIEFLEDYILTHGTENIVLSEEGYPTGDLAAGCTIELTNILETVNEALASEK